MSKERFLFAICASLICALFATNAFAKHFTFKKTDEYPVEKNFRLEVDNSSGDIMLYFQAGDKLMIETTKSVETSSRERAERIAEEYEVEISADKNSVRIETHYPHERHGDGLFTWLFGFHEGFDSGVDYKITVPTSVNLEVTTASGDVRAKDLEGEATISATSGDVELLGLNGNVEIQTTSGDVHCRDIVGNVGITSTSSDAVLENIEGDLTLQSTSGEIQVNRVSGKTDISNTSGDIQVTAASSDVDLRTSSGNIDVTQKAGAMFISSSSGDVQVRSAMVRGDRFKIETISGDIVLKVPSEMKGRVKLETVSGSINTDLAIEVNTATRGRFEGRIGGEGPDVIVSSTSGDILLEGF